MLEELSLFSSALAFLPRARPSDPCKERNISSKCGYRMLELGKIVIIYKWDGNERGMGEIFSS